MTDELPDLKAALELATARLEMHERKAAKWRERMLAATEPGEAHGRTLHQCQHQLRAALGRVAEDQKAIMALEEEMRRHLLDDDTAPGAVQPGQRRWATKTFTNGSKTYQRGREIDDVDVLAATLNGAFLLRTCTDGHEPRPMQVRHVAQPAPIANATPAVSASSSDPITSFALAIKAVLDQGRCSNWVDAQDLVTVTDSKLFLRAQVAFVNEFQMVRDGGFGSGGGSLVQSGEGTSRKVFSPDAFRERLIAIVREHTQQPQEAA